MTLHRLTALWLGALAIGASADTLSLVEAHPLQADRPTAAPWPAGTRWQLDAQGLRGPQPLHCPQARQQVLRVPAQGLFQGGWQAEGPEGAQARAVALGLGAGVSATLRLDCANASFDLHRAAPDQWLTVLDGQVLRLRVLPAADDAQAPVRQLLLQHGAEAGAFDTARLARLQAWLSPALRQAFERWFARPARPDEAPRLDGDPFTDTQEPPLALSLGELRVRGTQATQTVFVELDSGGRHRLLYRLQRRAGLGWRIADIDYGHGSSLQHLLRLDTSPSPPDPPTP